MNDLTGLAKMAPKIRALAQSHRAENPRVFGSVLHGRAGEGSDIDILVDAMPGATLFDLGGLQIALEELLETRVDLLTPQDISPRFRARVLAEARPI
jgi:predicted nucleotidyltransferase